MKLKNHPLTIINLTPHEINIHYFPEIRPMERDEGVISVPPSGEIARCAEERELLIPSELRDSGIVATRAVYGEVTGLADPDDWTIYIVSAMVAATVPDRIDVFAPGPAIRDDAGRIIGCKGLSFLGNLTDEEYEES